MHASIQAGLSICGYKHDSYACCVGMLNDLDRVDLDAMEQHAVKAKSAHGMLRSTFFLSLSKSAK